MLAADLYGTSDHRPPLVLLHGLTYDRRQWEPTLKELAQIDPGRRVLVVDAPGHGESPTPDSFASATLTALLHETIEDAGLVDPVVVGHSMGGVLATRYATTHPTRGVINIDQPLLVGPFAEFLRSVEPTLRGPDYLQVWNSLLAGMHIDLLPASAQEMVRTQTTPRQDLILGYWQELLGSDVPAELNAGMRRDLETLRAASVGYHFISGSDPAPEYLSWLEAIRPDVVVTVWPDSGHFPHLAHPARLAALLAAPRSGE
ncbi:alpha/beta hydrolase [Kineosporia sp. NBRC 101731]|uniref:alpha/beta hydrolase n=1 Tax=Kineosporia sp. NBRC 101731 TaxID=3032199 RepID=UPI0024A08EFE|nr:alpha/beta hydrolase [Kineosporia sp. NBRC 101731]GLY28136.1 hypothetical protein Kisp02_15010 [Kineosporia sp. NBRC 101731]